MKVAFFVGQSSSNIIKTLSSTIDNVEFYTYNSIGELIRESTIRHIFFDRIVFSDKVVGDVSELGDLVSYLSEYSDTTSVVMLCKSIDSDVKRMFDDILKSPIYLSAATSTITVSVLTEFIRADMGILRDKYGSSFIGDVKAVTGKYNSGNNSKDMGSTEKKKKKGFFGLFGGKEKKAQKFENSNVDSEDIGTARNIEVGVSKNSVDSQYIKGVDEVEKPFVEGGYSGHAKNTYEGIDVSNESSPSYSGSGNYSGEIKSETNDMENLSIGDFGEWHSDSGYLDEDSEEALRQELSDRGIAPSGDFVPEEDYNLSYSDEEQEVTEIVELDNSGIILVTGIRGVGVTSRIVNSAVNLVEEGKKVLIIDFDYKQNGVLSFIDTSLFFARGYMRGITNSKLYSEDGVKVLSNGYGVPVTVEDVLKINDIIQKGEYDTVYIDCPLDCIDLVEGLVGIDYRINILVEGNRGSIMSTFLQLTDCGNIEDDIYDISVIKVFNKISEYSDDLFFLKNIMLFGRCNWFSKLG